MIRSIALFIIGMVLFSIAKASEPLIISSYAHGTTSLNGEWNYIVDPYENGFYNYRYEPYESQENPWKSAFFLNSKTEDKSELLEYDFDASPTLTVPGDWNTQVENLYYYEGTVWYKKSFDYAKKVNDNRVFLYFGAVNYQADVYLNGTKLGTHVGGFTPFNFEVTSLLKETANFVVVKVDNQRKKEGIPTLNTDWWNYGGITREVKLVETPTTFLQDYQLQLDPENPDEITGYLQLNGPAAAEQVIEIALPEIQLNARFTTDKKGWTRVSIPASNIKKWAPESPQLYEVQISTPKETLNDLIGFRTIRTEGTDLLLNGEKIFLKGICLHEERPYGKGRGVSAREANQLLSWAQQLGCNYVRLAHYPHNEAIIRLADQLGIMVWEEIPVYWTIDWENESTYQNAENQLTEMISRDKNRAAVIIWSMANETPVKPARNRFLTQLATQARTLDNTRLISAALEQKDFEGNPMIRTISDPFAEVVDILSFNQYIGWYDGLPDKCDQINWKIPYNKPVVISEFGAGAKYGYRGDSLTRWTEDYQAHLYRKTLKMISRIDNLSGFSPWILVDFRSPRRPLPGIQEGWNRKGLISEQGEKKKAFEILRAYYQGRD